MANIKVTLEVDANSGELQNVYDQEGSPAVMATKERRKWYMHDIHISAGQSATPSRQVCPPGYFLVTINNCQYCVKY